MAVDRFQSLDVRGLAFESKGSEIIIAHHDWLSALHKGYLKNQYEAIQDVAVDSAADEPESTCLTEVPTASGLCAALTASSSTRCDVMASNPCAWPSMRTVICALLSDNWIARLAWRYRSVRCHARRNFRARRGELVRRFEGHADRLVFVQGNLVCGNRKSITVRNKHGEQLTEFRFDGDGRELSALCQDKEGNIVFGDKGKKCLHVLKLNLKA